MNSQKIDLLISKYELGDTTLDEERELKAFFAQEEIPAKYRIYREIFGFYDTAVREEFPDPDFDNRFFDKLGVSTESKKGQLIPFNRRIVWQVAASLVLLVGLYFVFQFQKQPGNEIDDPKLAYAETKKALMMISGNLNTGMKELSSIKTFDEGVNELKNIKSFNEGLKTMEKISTFNRSTNFVKQ